MSRKFIPRSRPAASRARRAGALGVAGSLVALLIASGGFPAAGAAGTFQAATPTPAPLALPGTISNTVSYDPAADLTTASVNLHAGYIMDPYLLPVVGKAEEPAGEMAKGCNGYIGSQPSVVVSWSGKSDQLNLFVYSDDDAVLAVQKPDGSLICNDDAGAQTVEPLISIKDPAPGAYKVHVGTARQNAPALGFLGITQAQLDGAKLAEMDLAPMLRRHERPAGQALEQLDPKSLLLSRAPIFGSVELKSDFKPVQVFAAGGGDIAAVRIEEGNLACAGFINAVPSYRFTYTGTPHAVRVYFEGLSDTSLAVVTPDQQVLCGMNATTSNLNPIVDIAAAAQGPYRVYVAAMEPNTVVGGRLTITGDKAVPAVLPPAGQ